MFLIDPPIKCSRKKGLCLKHFLLSKFCFVAKLWSSWSPKSFSPSMLKRCETWAGGWARALQEFEGQIRVWSGGFWWCSLGWYLGWSLAGRDQQLFTLLECWGAWKKSKRKKNNSCISPTGSIKNSNQISTSVNWEMCQSGNFSSKQHTSCEFFCLFFIPTHTGRDKSSGFFCFLVTIATLRTDWQ